MKKKILLVSTMILAIVSASMTVFAGNNLSPTYSFDDPYKIVMNSSKNKLFPGTGSTDYSGQSTIKTNNGNDIKFTYNSLAGGSSSVWHLIKSNGYFYNSDPIHGLNSIGISCTAEEKEYKILWGKDLSFDLGEETLYSSTTLTTFDFNNDKPTYFKFINTSGSNISIKSMDISLDCSNYYPNLTLSSDYVDRGNVYGGGIKKAGEDVTINAVANQGYKFVGWFENNNLISENTSYTFTIGYNDLQYAAHFVPETYNLTVISEFSEKGSVSDNSGNYDYLTPISIDATPNEGYSFDGWYSNNILASSNNPFVFNMPSSNLVYVAKFSTNSYELTLSSSDSELGSVEGNGTFLYGNNVTISAHPNKGIAFLGWFDTDDNLVSDKSDYSFVMPYHDVSYVAKFEKTIYTLDLNVNDSTMGHVSGNGSYTFGQNVTISATPNPHYSFFGWYDGETLISQESSYTFSMPDSSIIYEARFVKNYSLVVYSDDEDKGTVVAPTEWGAGLEVTLKSIPIDGYALDYWCDENYDELSYDDDYSFIMPSRNIEVIAVFAAGASLELESNFPDEAVTVYGSGSYVLNKSISISAQAIDGLVFDGWYDDDFNLVSSLNQYTFSIAENKKLIAYYHYIDLTFDFYEIDDSQKTCSLYGCFGQLPNTLFIPKLFQKYSVTSIRKHAFDSCSSLTSITIPDSVASIGDGAFYHCTSLISITIPASVTSIGFSAFSYCSSLTSIIIPNSVASIGSYAFSYCSSLTSITILDGIKSIGSYAFSGCTSLTSITIPDSVTSIGVQAFVGCTSLVFNIYDNANYLGNTTNPYFALIDVINRNEETIEINQNCIIIADYALSSCSKFSLIDIPDGVTSIGFSAFSYCSSLTSITIPNSVASIGSYAFDGCSSLTSITIPDSVTSIGFSAFSYCSSLTSITIPDSVTSIGSDAFYNCLSLTSIAIPDTVSSIGDGAFSGCSSLISITIPDGVTSIGLETFYNCSSLTSITIPDSVTSIGLGAFYNCTSLTSITIPDGIRSIGPYAFFGCSSLTSITIPDTVTSIGYYAFSGCSSLTSITIPDSVASIGEYAFKDCTSLTSIYCETPSKPEGWEIYWNPDNYPVVWGYKG